MSKVRMFPGKYAVERLTRNQKSTTDLFVVPETSNNLGVIKYSAPDALPVGTKVYFGQKYEQVRMQGAEVLIMDFDNVFAVLEDEEQKS